jgi:hypothetical protein
MGFTVGVVVESAPLTPASSATGMTEATTMRTTLLAQSREKRRFFMEFLS